MYEAEIDGASYEPDSPTEDKKQEEVDIYEDKKPKKIKKNQKEKV